MAGSGVGEDVSVGAGLEPAVLVGKSRVEVGVVSAGEPGVQAAKIERGEQEQDRQTGQSHGF